MAVDIIFSCELHVEPEDENQHSDDGLVESVEGVVAHLVNELDVECVNATVDTVTKIASFTLAASGPNTLKAVFNASSTLRAAIHATGGSTPGWDDEAGALAPVSRGPAYELDDFAHQVSSALSVA